MPWERGRGWQERTELARGCGAACGPGGALLGFDQRRGTAGHARMVEAAGAAALANRFVPEIVANRHLDAAKHDDPEECLALPSVKRSHRRGQVFQAFRLK